MLKKIVNGPLPHINYLIRPGFKTGLQVLACIIILSGGGCANMIPPGGGAIDTSAAKPLRMNPPNKSTRFTGDRIIIQFDEYIQLRDIGTQFSISPLLAKAPIVSIKKKNLEVGLEGLKENTTYTLHFGNAIADVNENNVLEDFTYVFSTGDYIDSLTYSGKVLDAMSLKPVAKATVLLYDIYPDSGIYKIKPGYFARTNEAGNFTIENIKPGDYTAYAILDKNNSMLYEEGEAVGFLDEKVSVNDSTTSKPIYLFTSVRKLPKKLLKAYTSGYGRFYFVFNYEACDVNITRAGILSKQPWENIGYSANCDTITYYSDSYSGDTVTFYLNDDDRIDTAHIRVKSAVKPLKVIARIMNGKGTLHLNDTVTIETVNSITWIDRTKITFTEDSILKTNYSIKQNREKTRLSIHFPWAENKSYRLLIRDSALLDILGNYNDTIAFNFKTPGLNAYGTVKALISGQPGEHYILQLMNEQEQILRKDIVADSTVIHYKYLLPGKYRIRIIHDTNKNGKWDTGNVLLKTQPEKVTFFDKGLNVKAGWDLEQVLVEIEDAK